MNSSSSTSHYFRSPGKLTFIQFPLIEIIYEIEIILFLFAYGNLKHRSADIQSDFTDCTIHVADDEPDAEGSPHHYVLIHGILTAPVIYHLNEIGVNVDSIICVKAQNYDSLTPTAGHQQDESKDGDGETAKVS